MAEQQNRLITDRPWLISPCPACGSDEASCGKQEMEVGKTTYHLPFLHTLRLKTAAPLTEGKA